MIDVTKGLVVREPWIDLILAGRKTWEMRSQAIRYRGWIGLIRKGSGAVSGVARIVGVGVTLSPEDLVATFDKHRIPEAMIRSGEIGKWTIPWMLADIRALPRPVPYRHPMGAIGLFDFEPAVSAAIAEALGDAAPTVPAAPVAAAAVTRLPHEAVAPRTPASDRQKDVPIMTSASSARSGRLLGETELTEGNLGNNHFYLRGFLTRFPDDLVGGRDREPPVLAEVEAEGIAPAKMDICSRHRFFRDRAWTRRFFEASDAVSGDVVQVTEMAPYRYAVTLRKRVRA